MLVALYSRMFSEPRRGSILMNNELNPEDPIAIGCDPPAKNLYGGQSQ